MQKKIFSLASLTLSFLIIAIFNTSNIYANETVNGTQSDLENIQQKINDLDKQIDKKTKVKKGITQELKKEEKRSARLKKKSIKLKRRQKIPRKN